MNSDLKFVLLTAVSTIFGLLALQFIQKEFWKHNTGQGSQFFGGGPVGPTGIMSTANGQLVGVAPPPG